MLSPREAQRSAECVQQKSNCESARSLLAFRLARVAAWRGDRSFRRSLLYRQSPLRDQVHSTFDRNSNRACVLVDVVVTLQRLLFLDADVVQLAAFVHFQPRIGKRTL